MGLLSWIIVGMIAGWLAGVILLGSGYGLFANILVGIIGAMAGGFLAGNFFNLPDAINDLNVTSLMMALFGAVVLIALLRAFSGNRRTA